MTANMLSSKLFGWSKIEEFNSRVFMSGIGGRTGANNMVELLQRLVTRTTSYTDMNDWFADVMHSIAFCEEYEPPLADDDPNKGKLLWRGWDQTKRYPDLLPLWLTLDHGSQYMASSSMLLMTGSTGAYETGPPWTMPIARSTRACWTRSW